MCCGSIRISDKRLYRWQAPLLRDANDRHGSFFQHLRRGDPLTASTDPHLWVIQFVGDYCVALQIKIHSTAMEPLVLDKNGE